MEFPAHAVPGAGVSPAAEDVLNPAAEAWEWAWARDLADHEGQVIILPPWAEPALPGPVHAVLIAATPSLEEPGKVVLDYTLVADATPAAIVVDAGEQIRFAP